MSIFNFGHKQRLHTQLYGNTSGSEMFKVDEYNQRKKLSVGLGIFIFIMITIFYFQIQNIPSKFLIFLIILTLGCIIWFYFNFKEQKHLRVKLY